MEFIVSLDVGFKLLRLILNRHSLDMCEISFFNLLKGSCLVKWDGGRSVFSCPCHAAIFDENGLVVSGPPPSALVEYTVKEVADKVYVSESA